jgi:hypothetical protein
MPQNNHLMFETGHAAAEPSLGMLQQNPHLFEPGHAAAKP